MQLRKKEQMVMEINIYNQTPRYVVAKYNISGLKKGEKYWAERISVHSCHTNIYIEGHDCPINSVHLEEDGIFAKIGERNINRIAIIDSPKDITLDICGYYREIITKEDIQSLKKGEFISIGRSDDNDKIVGKAYKVISRYHCIVYNDGKAIIVLDCSTNGTAVVI